MNMGIYQYDPNAEVADDYDNPKVQVSDQLLNYQNGPASARLNKKWYNYSTTHKNEQNSHPAPIVTLFETAFLTMF